LQHSAATSHAPAYRFKAPQGFAAPGSRPPLTRQTAHSDFKRGKNLLSRAALIRPTGFEENEPGSLPLMPCDSLMDAIRFNEGLIASAPLF